MAKQQFFEIFSKNSQLVNAQADYGHSPSFSDLLPFLFPENGYDPNSNVATWLDVFAKHFPEVPSNETDVQKVGSLIQNLGFDPNAEDNVHVFNFCVYFFQIYQMLLEIGYDGCENIGAFMNAFPIHQTRVVMLGNDPAKDEPSSGYAFHESPSPSTWQILEFLEDDLNLAADYQEQEIRFFKNQRSSCNLTGWIQQGVLLMNANLTIKVLDSDELWKIFTNFILKYLSDTLNNVVFILLGEPNRNKEALIDSNRHMIMTLYHPAFYIYKDFRRKSFYKNRDWETMIPFINTNFYIYQTLGPEKMIDWGNVDASNPEGSLERLRQLQALFVNAINISPNIDLYEGFATLGRHLIVVKNNPGYFTMKFWPRY